MSLADSAIEVSDLVKVYRGHSASPVRALDSLHLTVRTGEVYGLLGRNGAGKTTLLRILTTLIPPTSGRVRVLGHDVLTEDLAIRKKISVVQQENSVEMFLSVMDNLLTFARFHSIPAQERKKRAETVIEQFGLDEVVSQKLLDLSGGLKRRVQVAKVFMTQKPLVFLDEATTGMDPINKRATLTAISEQARQGRTVFLTTHILQEAEELCDSIAIIEAGKCVASGTLQDIKALIARVYDISITFDRMDDALLTAIRQLPHVKCDVKHTTIEMSVQGDVFATIDALRQIARSYTINHFEVGSATLEDVFVTLLGDRKE
jgi:ABC-2 type transport system ATP-binding protein